MEPDEVDGKITKAPYRALRDLTHLKAGETDRLKMLQRHNDLSIFHCHNLDLDSIGMMGQARVK